METETARLIKAGSLEMELAFEYQTSSEGTENAVPMALIYGISSRFELMIEPVLYTSINPKSGSNASGFGDIETTLSYLLFSEKGNLPAIALAGEVKIPTAKNSLLGTKKFDYAGYIIASKRFGKFDTHLNLGYTIVGQPDDTQLDNIYNFAFAAEYLLNKKLEIVGEILGNTSSFSSETGNESTTSPEITAGEIVGMIGARYLVTPKLHIAFGINYDNKNALLFRPGITYSF